MNKMEFLEQLHRNLRALPETEKGDALEYYEGYISDAENESEAITRLGTPDEVAATILANRMTEEQNAHNAFLFTNEINLSRNATNLSDPQNESQEEVLNDSHDNSSSDAPPNSENPNPSPFAGMKTAWFVILAIFDLRAIAQVLMARRKMNALKTHSQP